ncbi:hypothetical protein DL96DRAFT_1818539 [Flagelloscypha sp. PMI_526]|nr:hypothetical protein DL96DRAFT_1818539 [Flagelloscypha sp. PMI_526]
MPSNFEIIRSLYEEMKVDPTGGPMEKTPHFSDTFKCTTFPPSMGWPEMDRKAYVDNIKKGALIPASKKLVVDEIIDAGDKIVIQATAYWTLDDASEVVMSHLGIFTFKDGKIVHLKQFMDPVNVTNLQKKFEPQA